jgi:hypothetical protein
MLALEEPMKSLLKAAPLGLIFAFFALLGSTAYSAELKVTQGIHVTDITRYGKKVELYTTNYVGTYTDQTGRDWLYVPTAQIATQNAAMQMVLTDAAAWEKLGYFKLLNDATPEELQKSRRLDPTSIQGVLVDARGEKWAFVPDAKDPKDMAKGHYIRLETMTHQEMMAAFAGKFDVPAIVVESFKAYTPEQIKFSAALLAVNMSKCFGGGIAGLPFSNAKSFTPTCVDDFITHLTDPKGMVGFYFFILFNRGATQGLNQIAMILAANSKHPESMAVLRQKLAPLFGYLGMAAGSLASSVASHIMSAPSWGECFRLFNTEGLTSQPCREAYTYFLSIEGFWGDFVGSTGEMMTAAILAHGTQVALKFSAGYLLDSALARGGVRFLYGSLNALELTGLQGAGAVQVVRMVSGLTVASGAPGIVVFVVTQIGSYVLFLAWDEVLRAPFMQEYNSITKSWDIGGAIKKVNSAVEEGKKTNFDVPYTPEVCKDVRNPSSPRGSFKKVCTLSAPLDEGLKTLRLAATQYRKSVLMDGLDEATHSWKAKVTGYLSHYRASKMLLEYIHEIKEQKIATVMDVQIAGNDYVTRWKAALEREVIEQSKFRQEMFRQFVAIDALILQIGKMNQLEDDPSWTAKIKTFFLGLQEKYKSYSNPNYLSSRALLRKLLVENKKYAEDNINRINENPGDFMSATGFICDYLPDTCKVYSTYQKVNFEKLRVDIRSTYMTENNAGIVEFLASSFGSKVVNDVMYDFFCSERNGIELEGIDDNGRAAAFHLPNLIKGEAREEFLRDNCVYSNGQPKLEFTQEDFAKTWVYQNRSYADPIDVVIDAQTTLTTGFNTFTAEAWWQDFAFKPTMRFMANSVYNYQKLLQNSYAPLIPDDTPESLINRASPQMRGPELDYKIGSYIAFNPGARPALSVSLMGQTLFMLNHIKYNMSNGDSKTYDLADKLALAMAKLILTYRQLPDPAVVAKKMENLQQDLVQLELVDNSLQILPLEDFENNMKLMVLSPETNDAIISNMEEVHKLSSDLYKHLTGVAFDDMKEEKEHYKAGLTAEQQSKLSKEEYKKYIYFKLIYDNTNDIVINYLSLDLYEKLSLKPLLEIKNEELL